MNKQAGKPAGGGAKSKKKGNHFVRSKLTLDALRWAFKTAGAVSPGLTAHAALRLFLTPPRLQRPASFSAKLPSPDLHWYTSRGQRIASYRWGEGPKVLLVHGWGTRATDLEHFVLPLVERGFCVQAIDGPAHGASPGKHVDFMEFAAALAVVAERPAAVIAHSYGAACTLIAMHRYGLQTERLALLACPASAAWVTEDFGYRMSIKPAVLSAMRELLIQRRGGDWSWDQVGGATLMAKVEAATLLVHDRDDAIIPYEHALQLAQRGRNSELLTVDNLGHRGVLRDPTIVSRVVEHVTARASIAPGAAEEPECNAYSSLRQAV